jgi:hypothetical protein
MSSGRCEAMPMPDAVSKLRYAVLVTGLAVCLLSPRPGLTHPPDPPTTPQNPLYVNGSGAAYTDPEGNTWGVGQDYNLGSMTQPLATISAATSRIAGKNVTVIIAPGTYPGGANRISFPALKGLTYRAADPADKPVIDLGGANYHGIWIPPGGTRARVIDIAVTNTAAWGRSGLATVADSVTLDGVDISGSAYRTADISGGRGFKVVDCKLLSPRPGAAAHVVFGGGASGVVSNSIVDADNNASYAINNASSGDILISNCIITGGGSVGIVQNTKLAQLTVDSVVCFGNGMRTADRYAIENSNAAGLLRVYNSTINSGSAVYPWQKLIYQADADSANLFNMNPRFTRYKAAEGIVAISFDDNGDIPLWDAYAAAASARGVHLTFVIHERTWKTGGCSDSKLGEWLADGHDVGTHTYSHTYYDVVGRPAIGITYSGPAGEATVRVEDGHLITQVNGVDDLNFDLAMYSGYEASPPRHINELVTQINAHHDYHALFNPDALPGLNLYLKATSLADLPPTDMCHGPAEILVDGDRFYQDEIGDVSAWLEATIGGGYHVVSAVPPNNVMTAEAKAYMMGSTTIEVCRGGVYNAQDDILLRNVDLYNLYSVNSLTMVGDRSENQIKQAARAIASAAVEHGGVYAVFGHHTEFTSGEQLGWFIDALQEFAPKGLKILSMRELSGYVRDPGAGWTDHGDGIFTKTYVDSSDYGVEPSCPVDSFPWVQYPTSRNCAGVPISEARTSDHVPGQVVARFVEGAVQIPDGASSGTPSNIVDADVARVAAAAEVSEIHRLYRNATQGPTEAVSRTGRVISMPDVWDVYVLTFPSSTDPWTVADSLRAVEACVYAEPNGLLHACSVPVDSLFGSQWNLSRIGMIRTWDLQTGSPAVRIGILDTGIDYTSQAFGQAYGPGLKIGGGWDYIDNDSLPMDDAWGPFDSHGTLVAGVIGALTNDEGGVAGIAGGWAPLNQGCTLYALKAGDGAGAFPVDAVCNAVRDACLLYGIDVINAGFGGYDYYESLREALCDAHAMDVVVVAPEGNDGVSNCCFPSDYDWDWTVSVGASDDEINAPGSREQRVATANGYSWSSNYGDALDVLAPGVNIESTLRMIHPCPYGPVEGTSIAAAQVSGLAALMLSEDSTLCTDDVEGILGAACTDIQFDSDGGDDLAGRDRWSGWGRIVSDSTVIFLRAPYIREHHSCQGGTAVSVTGYLDLAFSGQGPLSGRYFGKRYCVRCAVQYSGNVPGSSFPKAWGLGDGASTGWSAASPNYQKGFCRVVNGTQTETGCVLESFVYEVWTPQGEYLGWQPCSPAEVLFAYTTLDRAAGAAVPGEDGAAISDVRLAILTGNPTRSRAVIRWEVPSRGEASLRVYDVQGREVRSLATGCVDRGRYDIEWDGRDSFGNRLAPGIYICRLEASGRQGVATSVTRKIVLIR